MKLWKSITWQKWKQQAWSKKKYLEPDRETNSDTWTGIPNDSESDTKADIDDE